MVRGAQQLITNAVTAWEDASVHPHRFGGVEYRLGNREIGHIHGDSMVDIPFPVKVRNELVALKRAEPHHLLPETGWISFYIRQPEDVEHAVALLRQSYDIALAQRTKRLPNRGQASGGEQEQ
jgi:predicted DNA-binding protein (MmcQ/YjbR family)